MNRIEALQDRCKNHLLYSRLARKLSEHEFDRVVEFIDENNELCYVEFERKVNRMFLDKEKPKNWIIMTELLTVSNTAAKGIERKVLNRFS